ncbi:MAG: hypothetical protein M1833_003887 [Piccolia ochrophora]|nr:MAG: hypothetical protein M1833_003887 [Piccolia ochrophora]
MTATKLQRNPPFRAEHLGSLLRPNDLLDVRHQNEEGRADASELSQIEDTSIQDIVKTQLDLGFHGISDGEYRRHMFWGTFFTGLQGCEEIHNPPLDMFRTYMPDIAAFLEQGHGPVESVVCTGKIKHVGSTYIDQWNYLKNLVPKERQGECKLTLPAPEWYHMRYREGRAYPKDVYANDAEYFADVAAAYRTELKILYDAGLRNFQIDDPNFAYFCSEKAQNGFKEHGEDMEGLLDAYIGLYNDCLKERPDDMHAGVHICRGNFVGSRHFSEGGYEHIATKLFNKLDVDTFYLEYDTPRAGGFEPLTSLPSSKNVILGLITSKFPELEDVEEMKTKVYQAADLMAKSAGQSREEALQRLGVSPQCGFASHSSGNAVTRDDMVAKLKLVRQLADSIWQNEP